MVRRIVLREMKDTYSAFSVDADASLGSIAATRAPISEERRQLPERRPVGARVCVARDAATAARTCT